MYWDQTPEVSRLHHASSSSPDGFIQRISKCETWTPPLGFRYEYPWTVRLNVDLVLQCRADNDRQYSREYSDEKKIGSIHV